MQSEAEKRPEFEDLERALDGDSEALRVFLEDVHPADLAEWAEELERPEMARVLDGLDAEKRSEVLKFADDDVGTELLEELSLDQIVEVVEELPADEVVDLLALTDEDRTDRILRAVDFERAQGLRKLARYDEETAGGLMNVEYVAVSEDAHVGDAIKLIRSEEGPAAEEEGGVFVIDPAGKPLGHVSDRELLTTPIHTPISEVMETDLITVGVNADQEEVARLFLKYSFSAVPVVDIRGALIGVISDEDAQEVLQEEAEEDISRLVGTSPEELQTRLPVLQRVRHRLPLQALTVLGGMVTAWLFKLVLPEGGEGGGSDILRYVPIIIGLAGNVGVQSSTILVRAYATGELSADREGAVLGSEVLVGFLIGVLCGFATMAIAPFIEQMPNAPQFGMAVGLAIAVAVTWASFLGCVVPMICRRLGIDPAIVAGPFLITLSDISGVAIFIAVTSQLLDLGAG